MIFANLEIANHLIHCANPDCEENPEYIVQDPGYLGFSKAAFIKKGTIYLYVAVGEDDECYCFNCIDIVYQELKPILDKKLWAFK